MYLILGGMGMGMGMGRGAYVSNYSGGACVGILIYNSGENVNY